MPLVRFEVRNEYGLGAAELFGGPKKYDSKDVLEGVAVAGMVGVLRQLGDLAELAAEVFQDLQEQVMAAADRSHKMMVRIQQMEETLPTVEKVVLSQKCHVYFAYTTGIDWHANVQPRENHLVHSDTPNFIFESYEKCRGPPRLELLDKFDPSGPGACLKKYSDPSIFKNALTRTNPQNAEKAHGERNAKNVKVNELTKKKGAGQRHLKVPHTVPTVNREGRSGRIQFAPAKSFGQNLSEESGIAFGVRLGSEVGIGSSSFDSRTSSDGAECAFDASSSVQNKEPGHEGLLSRLQRQSCEASDPVFPCDQVVGSHDIDTNKSLQEESIRNSPSITWVEKTEIVNPADRAPENIMEAQNEASGTSSMLSDSCNLENEASVLVNGGPDGSFGARQIVHGAVSNKNQFDDADNESDSDMTEEFETDCDHQTKETTDLQSQNFRISGREDEENSASFSIESNLSNKHAVINFAKSVSKEDFHPKSRNLLEVTDRLKDLEITIGDMAATDSNVPGLPTSLGDESIPNLNFSKKSDSLISDSSTSTKPKSLVSDSKSSICWTNGGLLGLEPSKPPDSKALNSANGDCLHGMQADEQCLSSETSIPKSNSDESTEKVNMSFKSRKPTEKNPGPEEGRERSSDYVGPNNLPPDQLTTTSGSKIFLANHSCSTLDHDKQDNSKDSSSTDRPGDAHGCDLVNSSIGNLGTEFCAIPDVQSPSNEENKKNLGSLTGIFRNDRLDINISNSLGESSEFMKKSHLKLQNSHSIQQKGSNGNLKQTSSISNHGENLEHKESTDFLCSSPPVQHMKISFNPVGGLETPKLKLKITDELHFSEGTTDFVFSSFQLLPEHPIQPKDIDYESDDETMYGSSLYMSDELMSHLSEASAEQWESDEAPADQGSKGYGASHRTSSIRSISSSGEPEGIAIDSIYADSDYKSMETDNGLQTMHDGSVFELPSFVADGSLEGRKDEKSFIYGNCQDFVLQHLNESMPPPPPLPPLQWRVRKNQSNATDNEHCTKSEALSHTKHLQGSAFNSFQHMKLDPSVQQRRNEAVKCPSKSEDQQNFNGQREVSMVINGQAIEKKEDFLRQINRQSLNLRSAVKELPMRKLNHPRDVKVTVILEKANAIRQAFVGSDEEDDDD